MFCQTCGKEIKDNAVICPNCGCPTGTQPQQATMPQQAPVTSAPSLENGETTGMATAAIVCAFLIPIAGLILGIVGVVKYKTPNLKNRCIIAIVLSIVVWIITAVVLMNM